MNQHIRYAFYLIFVLNLISCTHKNEQLTNIEELMKTSPDSALHALQKLPKNSYRSSSDKAFYALLLSQAYDKNDIKVESDSLISQATNYYTESDPIHAGYAWLYTARCAANRGNAEVQAASLLKAQAFAVLTQEYKLQGLIYCDKADMYQAQQQSDSTIILNKKAFQAFRKANDSYNAAATAFSIGIAHLSIEQSDSSLKYLHLSEQIARPLHNNILYSSIYKGLGNHAYHYKNYRQALALYRAAPPTHIESFDHNTWYLLGSAYYELNQLDSAKYYLSKVKNTETMAVRYNQLWQNIYTKEGNYKSALFYAQKYVDAKDTIYTRSLNRSFAGMERKYKYEHLSVENQNLVIKNKEQGIFILAILLVMSIAVIVLLFINNKTKKIQLKTQLALNEKDKILLENATENNHLLQQQNNMQKHLLIYIEQYKLSVRKGNATTDGLQIDKKIKQEIIIYVDTKFKDISLRLARDFTQLTKRDVYICCMLLADFNTGMIASILNIQNDSVNIHRSRLRKKLGMETDQNLILFLQNV